MLYDKLLFRKHVTNLHVSICKARSIWYSGGGGGLGYFGKKIPCSDFD